MAYSNSKLIRKYLTANEMRLLNPQQAYELAKFTQAQVRLDARDKRHRVQVFDIDRVSEWTDKLSTRQPG